MSDLDETRLSEWLAANVPLAGELQSIEKFPGGQSNPTYRLETAGGGFVLRRKPFGPILPSAHAIDREYRLIGALHPLAFPVARPFAICDDAQVLGAPFYLMELVNGRTFWNGALPGIAVEERRSYYEAAVDTMAALHAIDYEGAGLSDFGRPGNYFSRQIERWTKQYRASQTDHIEEVERLIEWLPRTTPSQTRTSIIHGDYRIDNLIFDPEKPAVRAVIDWELATIGDPLADFTYLAMHWILPHDGHSGLGGLNLEAAGLPTLEEITARYCTASGREAVPDLHWYFSYNLFRLLGIVQGIKKRVLDGNASSAEAATAAKQVVPLAKAAWAQALKAKI